MTDLRLSLEGEALGKAISAAVMGQLTPEVQTALIERAIQAMITKDRSAYGRTSTPLEDAFESAVNGIVREVATELVKKDVGLRDRINVLMHRMMTEMMAIDDPDNLGVDGQGRKTFAARMADAFIAGMSQR